MKKKITVLVLSILVVALFMQFGTAFADSFDPASGMTVKYGRNATEIVSTLNDSSNTGYGKLSYAPNISLSQGTASPKDAVNLTAVEGTSSPKDTITLSSIETPGYVDQTSQTSNVLSQNDSPKNNINTNQNIPINVNGVSDVKNSTTVQQPSNYSFSLEFDAKSLAKIFGAQRQTSKITRNQDFYLQYGVTSNEYTNYLITFYSYYQQRLGQTYMFGKFGNGNERKATFAIYINQILQALQNKNFDSYITLVRQTIGFVGNHKIFGSPLVIYFTEQSYNQKLKDTFIPFDFDSDGKNEQIPFVADGAGFLAIDINNDNQITSGMELFGPSTNDGFRELSAFDQNFDGIIDSNDKGYGLLKIWMKDRNNEDILVPLSQTDVKSISLKDIQYFAKEQFNIFSLNTGDKLGYVLSSSYLTWKNGKNGIIEDLMLKIIK